MDSLTYFGTLVMSRFPRTTAKGKGFRDLVASNSHPLFIPARSHPWNRQERQPLLTAKKWVMRGRNRNTVVHHGWRDSHSDSCTHIECSTKRFFGRTKHTPGTSTSQSADGRWWRCRRHGTQKTSLLDRLKCSCWYLQNKTDKTREWFAEVCESTFYSLDLSPIRKFWKSLRNNIRTFYMSSFKRFM